MNMLIKSYLTCKKIKNKKLEIIPGSLYHLFTPSTRGRARAHTPDGVCTDAFSLAAKMKCDEFLPL